jgi:small nuclear ribonucleoprotein (snRNP)-like protein
MNVILNNAEEIKQAVSEGKYKNKIPLERKIGKLCNELEIEKERYNKEMEAKYWQNEATY